MTINYICKKNILDKLLFIPLLLLTLACSNDESSVPAENLSELEVSMIEGSPWNYNSAEFVSVAINEQDLSEAEMLQETDDLLNSVNLVFNNNRTVTLNSNNGQVVYDFSVSDATMTFISDGDTIGTLEEVQVDENQLSYIDTFEVTNDNGQTNQWKARLFFMN